jgi:hypothetical protein
VYDSSIKTSQQVKAAFNTVLAVTEAIREAKEIPAGTVYAALVGRVDLQGFQKILSIIKGAGLIEERTHLLRWIGPQIA